jgi:hypothetical protein
MANSAEILFDVSSHDHGKETSFKAYLGTRHTRNFDTQFLLFEDFLTKVSIFFGLPKYAKCDVKWILLSCVVIPQKFEGMN